MTTGDYLLAAVLIPVGMVAGGVVLFVYAKLIALGARSGWERYTEVRDRKRKRVDDGKS